MAQTSDDSRPGFFQMFFSWSAWMLVLIMALCSSVAISMDFFSGASPDVPTARSVGTAVALALVGLLGIRFLLAHRMTDWAEIEAGALVLQKTRILRVENVSSVSQVLSNPFFWGEWPIRSWRHWVEISVARGAHGRARTYFVWRSDPVAFLAQLADAGFPVVGQGREP